MSTQADRDIEALQNAVDRAFEPVMDIMRRQREETTRPLIVEQERTRRERAQWGREHANDPATLQAHHDYYAQRDLLRPPYVVSRQWWDEQVELGKEMREDG